MEASFSSNRPLDPEQLKASELAEKRSADRPERLSTICLNNRTFSIGRPHPSELEQLTTLYHDCRSAVDSHIVPEYFAAFPPSMFSGIWKLLFEQPQTQRALIVYEGTKPVGFCRVGAIDWSYAPLLDAHQIPISMNEGELHQIYLLPDCHRVGLGSHLYELAKRDLKALGHISFIICTYTENESAKNFYRSMGATQILDTTLSVRFSGKDFDRKVTFFRHSSE